MFEEAGLGSVLKDNGLLALLQLLSPPFTTPRYSDTAPYVIPEEEAANCQLFTVRPRSAVNATIVGVIGLILVTGACCSDTFSLNTWLYRERKTVICVY